VTSRGVSEDAPNVKYRGDVLKFITFRLRVSNWWLVLGLLMMSSGMLWVPIIIAAIKPQLFGFRFAPPLAVILLGSCFSIGGILSFTNAILSIANLLAHHKSI
jgi:hypothetical protein